MSGPTYNTVRDRIEQAIACRWDLDRICDTLGVQPRDVDDALHRMDAAVQGDFNSTVHRAPREDEVDQTPFNRWTCGTHAGFVRHAARGEPIDAYCRSGERKYQREYHGRQRARRALNRDQAVAS